MEILGCKFFIRQAKKLPPYHAQVKARITGGKGISSHRS